MKLRFIVYTVLLTGIVVGLDVMSSLIITPTGINWTFEEIFSWRNLIEVFLSLSVAVLLYLLIYAFRRG